MYLELQSRPTLLFLYMYSICNGNKHKTMFVTIYISLYYKRSYNRIYVFRIGPTHIDPDIRGFALKYSCNFNEIYLSLILSYRFFMHLFVSSNLKLFLSTNCHSYEYQRLVICLFLFSIIAQMFSQGI